MKTEMSLKEVLSQNSAIFRRAIGDQISGNLDREIKKSLQLKESQKQYDFLSLHADKKESDSDKDEYSPKNLKKHIPASNLFKDLKAIRTTAKDFNWKGEEEYF